MVGVDQLVDPIERKLAERLQITYVEGKKKKQAKKALVPILFTAEMVRGIRILVNERSNIDDSNKSAFAAALKGWDTLQAITKQISTLQRPQLITPTRMRKHLATVLQLLDLTDGEVSNHMGHTKDTHLSWNRKEDSTIELTKMAKILTAVDEGKSLQNKKVDNVLTGDDRDVEAAAVESLEPDENRKGIPIFSKSFCIVSICFL